MDIRCMSSTMEWKIGAIGMSVRNALIVTKVDFVSRDTRSSHCYEPPSSSLLLSISTFVYNTRVRIIRYSAHIVHSAI